ncbi:HNH endonuclease [Trebonia kvetii]|uniref:HNH endonuclease n=1 Tax=Trebonia kvetii TaxID=2480626 RepID=A0A6P2C5R8_9ACTN|nr:HNH endonuclease [Trebonia kvetii]TVZ06744.1 HNH endonuclease [Trebonia kvetii]
MDWQAAGDWQGGTPGRPADLPALLAAFEHGGAWERAAPSAALAVALETAAGSGGLYAEADADALVGIVRQWAAVESWAAAGMLGALRALMRDDDAGAPVLRRRTDLPGGWDDSLTYEIAAALAMGPQSAGNLANLAWTLGMRLPGIGRLLAGGILTRSKARLVAQVFEPLDEDEAARAEALIAGELEGKTYPQVERLAWRAALAVAPDAAERRRSRAERAARVTVFREQAGTVGMSGRDLPAAEALAGHANVAARAAVYAASGAFPGQDTSRLQAQAYLDLLGGVPAADRIAFAAAAAGAEPPGEPGPDAAGHDGDDVWFGGDDGDGPGPGRGDGGGGSPAPGLGPVAGTGDISGGPDPGGGDDDDPADDADDDIPDLGDDDDGRILEPGGDDADHSADDPDDDIPGPGDDDDDIADLGGDGGGPGEQEVPEPPSPPLAEVTVPLATLQRRAERAGDNRLLGPLDPALARQLAAAAARSPHSRWEIIIVDEHGYAIGHGIARPARGRPGGPQPPGPGPRPALGALPARVNLTITETRLRQLAQAAQPRSGAPPGDWHLTPRKPGTWALTLPGGRQLSVRFDVVPTHHCDHRYQTSAYQPGDRLRRLVQVRDHQCTFPTCSRAARESDFEHAVPYDKGGKTDACNAGARSRRCHQVKQTAGWTVTQPKPGWHQWTTPAGRTYTQEPWRYTA